MSAELNRKLVGGLNRKEEEARKEIFDRYYPEMLVYSIRKSEDMAYAQGFATDAFMKVMDRSERFETMEEIRSTWYVITRNLAIDHNRDQEKMKIEDVNVEELPDESTPDDDEAIPGAIFDRLVYESVEKLPRKNKAVFKLHYYEKKSNEEISELLKMKPKTVDNQIRLARLRLVKAIGPKKKFLFTLLISFFL